MNKDTSNIDYWIGLRRDGGSWVWGNGETFNYSNWGDTWSTSNCVTLKTADWNFGNWQVNDCNDNNKFICYKDLQDPTTVQPDSQSSPTTPPSASQTQSQQPSTMGSTAPPAATDLQDTTTVQSDSQSSPTTGPATSQTPDEGEQSQQPSTVGGTSPPASSPGHSGTSPASEDLKPSSSPSTLVSKDPNTSEPPSTPGSKDKTAIGRVKFAAPIGMNLEDPKVSEAILEQIQEHLSQKFPMDGMKMRWRKQDGEIFHHDVEEEKEEDEGKCSDL
ncbi:mucin-1-like [Polyodon spathula]|uniref:mucin-1-like n=1 Tax=Polyodon spathula TaxID=7913 RepID=UPI001B7F121C|nr:mucin-1-like [Polyodon spathula]